MKVPNWLNWLMTCGGLGPVVESAARLVIPATDPTVFAAAEARGQPVNCLNCQDFDGPHGDPTEDVLNPDGYWEEEPNGYCLSDRNTVADRAAGYAGHFTDESSCCHYWRPTPDIRHSRRPPVSSMSENGLSVTS